MYYLRKLIAIGIILFTFYLFLPSLSTGFQSFSRLGDLISDPTLRDSGNMFLTGAYLLGDLLFFALIFFLLRFGFKMFREKKRSSKVL